MPQTRQQFLRSREVQSDQSDDNDTPEELNTTIRKTESSKTTMEEQLQSFRKQLEAALAAVESEKQERQRLEQLLVEQQNRLTDISQPEVPIVTVSTNLSTVAAAPPVTSFITTSDTSTSGSVTAAIVSAINASHSLGTSTASTISFATSGTNLSDCYAPTHQCNMSAGPTVPQTTRIANTIYSWSQTMPSTSNYVEPFPMNSVNFSSNNMPNTRTVPTFLSPSTGFENSPQHFAPFAASMQSQPTQQSTAMTNVNGSHRKLHDLPEFHGKPEEWPMFCTAFIESTNMFGYSKVENMFRLQKSVKGEARDVVESLLIHPDNVEQVLANLEFRFGRPECLVHSQLKKVRVIPPIPDYKLELIIPFATKIQNLSVFLETSEMHQHLANPTLLEELIMKLPMNKRIEWAQYSVNIQPYATIKHFSTWLNQVARLICMVTSTSMPSSRRNESPSRARRGNVLHTLQTEKKDEKKTCRYCKEMLHSVSECKNFTKLQTSAKWDFVKRNNLCFGCLKYGHSIKTCRSKKPCGIANCRRSHHKSLHEIEQRRPVSERNTDESAGSQKPVFNCEDLGDAKILFRVLPVRVFNGETMIKTYALLDEGSSVTLISSDLAKRLKLNGKPKNLNLRWIINVTEVKKSSLVDIAISADQDEAIRFQIQGVQTVEELCLPTQTFAASNFFPRNRPNVYLPSYDKAKPEILIGLDNCHLGAPIKVLNCQEEGPIIALTKLGWVVYENSGLEQREKANGKITLFAVTTDQYTNLSKVVDEYFSIESFGVKRPTEKLSSDQDKRALRLLHDTTLKLEKRYQTGLLWKKDLLNLPDSFELAKKRLHSLEAKLRRDPEFAITYKAIIKNYLEKGYAVKMKPNEACQRTPNTWYLPHFGVKNPNKPGKVRLVFDAAAAVDGVSLNSFLMKGPDEYVSLVEVLFNFRMRPVAVTGDIKEMFHQVLIQPEDQNAQRFLWREDEGKPIDVYLMRAMTFGAACSPCSANYIKNLNALRFQREYPRATKSIIKYHYVDDFIDSFEDVLEAITVTKAVVGIHLDAGFELRNFASNSKEVLDSLAVNNSGSTKELVNMDMEATTTNERVLGLCWNSEKDVLTFRLNFLRVSRTIIMEDKCPTKREFLSIVMSVFDPLGMIANYTLPLKLILKSVWSFGVGWDEPIPKQCFERWRDWKTQMPNLAQLKVPRCHYQYLTRARRVELHTFVDASEEAFSAVVYLRIQYKDEINVSFVCGKTKVSPKKLLSIPRLELSAAILGIRLCDTIAKCHELPIAERIFWSDSKTVLHWLRLDPRRHKEFVAFRVAEILQSSNINQWRWVPSKDNPADDATRFRNTRQFRITNKWLMGPNFLNRLEMEWPPQPDDIDEYEQKEEIRSKYLLNLLNVKQPSRSLFDASKFRSFLNMKRSVARLIRFINACQRKPIERAEFTAQELKHAENLICRETQKEAYVEDLENLRRNLPINKSSQLFKMTPYIDDLGLIRSLGRIDAAATIPFETRRPIIIPKDHAVTRLLVNQYHRRFCHQNDDTVVNEIRQRFWVPNLRSAVKKCRRNCLLCRIRHAKPSPPLMGQLPEDRLTPYVRPFTYTGLDFLGPVNVAIRRCVEKRWVALFTCLTIRAVHLGVAVDLSTDACILCIRNFVNRRGTPLRIRSDNGTNFVGANKELLTNAIFDREAIRAEFSSAGIEWLFNCPANPHAGGCWERLVQSVKRALSHTLKDTTPKIEILQSALIEAENIVNSRPLTTLPISIEEDEPLTPNHFLLGVPNSTQTPGPIDQRSLCLRKRWKVSQQLKDRFWKRWIREYLPVLTRRCKWFEKVQPLEVGDLVLVCDSEVPRSHWKRGRIVEVFSGPDGQVRSARVKTADGELRRPAVKLAVLDVRLPEERPGRLTGGGMSRMNAP